MFHGINANRTFYLTVNTGSQRALGRLTAPKDVVWFAKTPQRCLRHPLLLHVSNNFPRAIQYNRNPALTVTQHHPRSPIQFTDCKTVADSWLQSGPPRTARDVKGSLSLPANTCQRARSDVCAAYCHASLMLPVPLLERRQKMRPQPQGPLPDSVAPLASLQDETSFYVSCVMLEQFLEGRRISVV